MTNTNTNARLTILRGLPGSGKSRFAGKTVVTVIASADNYPELYSVDSDGVIQLDMTKLDPAHGASVRTAIEGLQAGRHVVVDNTNLSAEELIPYVAIAQAFRVDCEIVTVIADPETAFARQTHGVPYAVCKTGDGETVRHMTPESYRAERRRVTVVAGFLEMVGRFEAFEAPFHWQFLPWLTLRTEG